MMLPPVELSTMLNATTVGQLLPEAGPNVVTTLLEQAPLAGFEKVTEVREYPLPVSSVPLVLTVGATEYKAAYTVAGLVYD